MKPSGHYEKFSDRQRYVDIAIVTVAFAPVVWLVVIMITKSEPGVLVGWITAVAAALLYGLIVFLIYRKKQVFVTDPPPQIILSDDEIKANAEATAKWERIEKMWWYRYPVAALAFGGAWFVWEWRPHLWWVSVIAVLYGLVLAKEVGLLAFYLSLAGIGIYLATAIFQGLATLPVSAAIIIGAIIIAGAVSRSRD